ncbi:hypothetical protein EDB80DRAFT_160005 [Ilyonectria destructans]|nr:hypothetical protein EDB80DRAFT_160005 [Ilyonectria destructans]
MDPVSVLGLVSSVITIIDTSWKAVRLYREIQESGTSGSNSDRNDVAKWLGSSLDTLASRIRDSPQPSLKEDQELLEVSEKCQKLAITLHKEIQRLQDSKKPAMVKLVASVLRSREIRKLEGQLEQYSRIIDSIILKRLGSQSIVQLQNTKQVDAKVQQILTAISGGCCTVNQLRSKLQIDIEQASETILQSQESSTKEVTRHQEDQSQQTRDLIIQQDSWNHAIAARADEVEALLKSLSFPEMFSREEEIQEPHETCCSFIFRAVWNAKNRHIDETGESRFAQWLRENQSLFWITGKAGTGKSVIMKYAHNHKTTLQCLMRWAGQPPDTALQPNDSITNIVILRHFFWKPGSHLQRTPKGLVRSLLWQLIQQGLIVTGKALVDCEHPSLINHVHLRSWTLPQLRKAFEHAISNLPQDVFTCVFIDALDECVDDDGSILSVIQFLSQSPKIKVCVSSRPEEFSIELRDKTSIRLQDLNGNAIFATAESRLRPLLEKQYPKEPDRRRTWILNDIWHGSEGVFLWAELVIKETKKAIEIGESLEEIRRIIREETPRNIADLFQHMVDKIHPRYMNEMRQYLAVLSLYDNRHWRRPNLLNLIFINKTVWSQFKSQNWEYFASEDFLSKCAAFQSRIEICAGGLIEIPPYFSWPTSVIRMGYEEPFLKHPDDSILRFCRQVRFVHRSVGELLFVGDGRNFSGAGTATWKQQSLRACIHGVQGFIGLLPLLPCLGIIQYSPDMLLEWLQILLAQLEVVTEAEADVDLVSQSYALCESVSNRFKYLSLPNKGSASFPEWWIRSTLFSRGRLEVFDIPCFASLLTIHAYLKYWNITFRPSKKKLTDALWYATIGLHDDCGDHCRSISVLLTAGSDPNQPFLRMPLDIINDNSWNLEFAREISPWTLFLSKQLDISSDYLGSTIRAFIQNGARIKTTTLQADSVLLNWGYSPTFIIEISPLSIIRRESKVHLPSSPSLAEDVERNRVDLKAIVEELECRGAVEYLRIRAFKLVEPDDFFGDDNDTTTEGFEEEGVQETAKAPSHAPSPAAVSAKKRQDEFRGQFLGVLDNLYLFTEHDSQIFQDLMIKFFPDFPQGMTPDAVIQALKHPQVLEFLRSREAVEQGGKIPIPLWFNSYED